MRNSVGIVGHASFCYLIQGLCIFRISGYISPDFFFPGQVSAYYTTGRILIFIFSYPSLPYYFQVGRRGLIGIDNLLVTDANFVEGPIRVTNPRALKSSRIRYMASTWQQGNDAMPCGLGFDSNSRTGSRRHVSLALLLSPVIVYILSPFSPSVFSILFTLFCSPSYPHIARHGVIIQRC